MMWTSRTKNAAAFGTVTRFTRRHLVIKSQYDALVIGGGGFCAEFAIGSDVDIINLFNILFGIFFAFLRFISRDTVQYTRVIIACIFTKVIFVRRT